MKNYPYGDTLWYLAHKYAYDYYNFYIIWTIRDRNQEDIMPFNLTTGIYCFICKMVVYKQNWSQSLIIMPPKTILKYIAQWGVKYSVVKLTF